jgi:APA family basic amino acid/polyamine antiporter
MTESPDDRRSLGVWMCSALVVGNMIGAGVFLLPASLAPFGAANGLSGWSFTVVGAVLLAVVFARLVRGVPGAGGPYLYPRQAFGEAAGFLVAWTYWVSTWVGNAAIATGATASLTELVPPLKTIPGAPALVSAAMVWILTWVNWRGARTMGWVQVTTTVMKLFPLFAVCGLGLFLLARSGTAAIVAEPQPWSVSGATGAAILALWALLGLESATVPVDRVKDPERTIAWATVWGTLATGIVCIVGCMTAVLLLPRDVAATSSAPFVEVARRHWGEGAAILTAALTFVSAFGCLNGWIFIQAEMPRVLAEEGIFPRVFARSSRHGTPGTALCVTSGLVSALVLMNYSSSLVKVFTFVILISTSANLLMYLACSLAGLKLAAAGRLPGSSPAFMAVAALACAYSAWTLYGAGQEAFLWCLALCFAGVPVYLGMVWARPGRRRVGEAAPVAPS